MENFEGYGNNIARLRRAQKLSQREVASRSLLSINHFQNIEYGHTNTTMETLGRIAKTLGVNPLTLGVFPWTDKQILALLHCVPEPTGYIGEPLNPFQNIVLVRKAYDLTQRKLSFRSGVSVATLRNIEHGVANISVSTLLRIAEALAIPTLKLCILTTPEEEFIAAVHETRRAAGLSTNAQLFGKDDLYDQRANLPSLLKRESHFYAGPTRFPFFFSHAQL